MNVQTVSHPPAPLAGDNAVQEEELRAIIQDIVRYVGANLANDSGSEQAPERDSVPIQAPTGDPGGTGSGQQSNANQSFGGGDRH